jgi:hypothetical protein
MNLKILGIGTMALLIGGLVGLMLTPITLQNLNILLFALLGIAIFLANHRVTMDRTYGSGFRFIRYFVYLALIVGFPVYFIGNLGSWTPFYSLALTVGLTLSNWIFRQNA